MWTPSSSWRTSGRNWVRWWAAMRSRASSSASRTCAGVAAERGAEVRDRNPHGVQLHAVEPRGQLEEGGVAPGTDLGEDLPDHGDGLVAVDAGSGQTIPDVRHATEVESVEHGGQGTGRSGRCRYALTEGGARKSAVSLHADLGSLQSTLDQVLARLDEASTEVRGTTRDDLLGDLYEIERHLQAASRRLRRAMESLPESRR